MYSYSSPIFVDMDTAAIILSLAAPPSELMTKTHNEMYILNSQLICCTQPSLCASSSKQNYRRQHILFTEDDRRQTPTPLSWSRVASVKVVLVAHNYLIRASASGVVRR